MMNIEWEDPGVARRSRYKASAEILELAALLREQPGRWAKVDRGPTFARNVSANVYRALPVSEFEAFQRKVDGTVWCFIRARAA